MGVRGNDGGFGRRRGRGRCACIWSAWIGNAGVRRARIWGCNAAVDGQNRAFSQEDDANQDEKQRPEQVPEMIDDTHLVKKREHSNEKQNGGGAQAVDKNVAVHLGPPCDSPRRRTTSQTP